MKLAKVMIVLGMVASLTLVGCGTSSDSSSASNQNQTQTTPAVKGSAVKDGVAKMLQISADLKTAIDAGDEAKVKTLGPQLEDTWSAFEDQVKPKFPNDYEAVEKYLDPTVAGSKSTPLDKQTLSQLNSQLSDALTKLQQNIK